MMRGASFRIPALHIAVTDSGCFEALYSVVSPVSIMLYHSRFIFHVKLGRGCTLCRRCADLGT